MDIISVYESSSCQCEDECDCAGVDSLAFKINGIGGCGGGELVYDDETKSEVFACKFLGWEFKSDNSFAVVEHIRHLMKPFKSIEVRVGF